MAAGKKIDVRIRMERQKQKILRLREELEKAQSEYEDLVKERNEQEKEELYQAFKKSKKSYEETMEFLKGKVDI